MTPSPSRAIAFVGSRLILRADDTGLRLPTVEELSAVFGAEHLETTQLTLPVRERRTRTSVFSFPDEIALPNSFRLDGLRVAYHALDEVTFRVASTARQRVEWHRNSRFCSRCGTHTEPDARHEAMRCRQCGLMHFPRIAPAVIVLVQRDRYALLGRSPHFAEGVYSTLAGFVEPGETLEECAHREIFEEAGVRIDHLRYFGSQPHPFPHSLMIGFVADWVEGDIRIEGDELEDARWFGADELPTLPHPMSIARALIDDFVRRVS